MEPDQPLDTHSDPRPMIILLLAGITLTSMILLPRLPDWVARYRLTQIDQHDDYPSA